MSNTEVLKKMSQGDAREQPSSHRNHAEAVHTTSSGNQFDAVRASNGSPRVVRLGKTKKKQHRIRLLGYGIQAGFDSLRTLGKALPRIIKKHKHDSRLWYTAFLICAIIVLCSTYVAVGFGRSVHTAEGMYRETQGVAELKEVILARLREFDLTGAREGLGVLEKMLIEKESLLTGMIGFDPNGLHLFEEPKKDIITMKSLTSHMQMLLTLTEQASQSIALMSEEKRTISAWAKEYEDKVAVLSQELNDLKKTASSNVISYVNPLVSAVSQIHKGLHLIGVLSGSYGPKNYLVVFQNSAEMRPTGGFMGSFAEVKVEDGSVRDTQISDIFSVDNQIVFDLSEAPKGLDRITGSFSLRDANYEPDYTVSGKYITAFWDKAGKDSIDGVVFIQSDLLRRILQKTGPLKVPHVAVDLSAENMYQWLGYVIESKKNKQNPKQILADIYTLLESKLRADTEIVHDIAPLIVEEYMRGNIGLYLTGAEDQALYQELSAPPSLARAPGEDRLMVVDTNIGGNKSDAYITMSLEDHVDISHDSYVDHTLVIRKKHAWSESVRLSLERLAQKIDTSLGLTSELINILGAGENVSYLRLVVPSGATLLESDGVDTISQTDHTIFSTTMTTLPSTVREVVVRYRVPLTQKDSGYTLRVERHPGGHPIDVKFQCRDTTGDIIRVFPESMKIEGSEASGQQYLDARESVFRCLSH